MQSLITSKTNQIKLACCIEADSWSNVKSLLLLNFLFVKVSDVYNIYYALFTI